MFFQLPTYLIAAAALFVFSAIKILREYERGVISCSADSGRSRAPA